MKREIGKWFLDIAKYIVTAVVLKELFGGFEEKSVVVAVATLTALFAFISGIIILRGADLTDKRQGQRAQESKNETKDKVINNNANSVEARPKQASKKKGNRK